MANPLPLDLYGEVTTADGTRYKWDANQPVDSRPQNFSFRTKIGEGFSDASLQFARRIDQDYADLNLIDNVVFTGADGSIAYEGRNSAMPRDLSDRHVIGVTLAGWMAHAKDRQFSEIYVDRGLEQFAAMPLERQAVLLAGGVSLGDFSASAGQGGLVVALPNQALGTQTLTEAWYQAPPTTTIAKLAYRGTTTVFPAGWSQKFLASDSRSGSSTDSYTPTMDDTLRTVTLSTARAYVFTQTWSNGNASTPAAGSNSRFSKLAVYGSHGLTLRTGDSAEPQGVYASDALRNIAQRWCPQLDVSGIETNDYVIQHLAFRNATFPFDAFLEINKYSLWHLGVWDNKTFVYRPYDLTDYDWEIRTDDQGTTFSPQGPSTDTLFNGIAVTYTNPLTGVTERITPETTSTLADTSSENPWNAWDINHWDEITLSSPALPAQAALLGQAALAERNRPKTPGTITVRGYIRDRAGNEQPCWKVRAGDTIAITNFPNDTPRLIVETDYNDEEKSIRIAVDKPFALLDAYLDRQQNALQAAGLA